MTENRRYGILHPHPELTLCQILQEAHHRWLRPTEICEILHNYRKFNLTPDPPQKPQSGSLFLFDRKALRYFRKDGHNWRKKKDGKTVREAHERLKVGSVDVLHCYYAHGENNENFQRRCYWLLEGAYEHIVLVHYREVKEGSRSGAMHALNGHSVDVAATAMAVIPSPQSSPFFSPEASPRISSPSTNTVEWNGHACESEGPTADSSDETEPYAMFEEQRASLYQSSNGALQSCTSFSIKNTAFACGESEMSNSLYNNNNAKAFEALVSHVENRQDNIELMGADKFYPKQLQLPAGRFNSTEWSNYPRHGTLLYDGLDKHETTDAPSWTDVLGQGSALQQHGLLESVVASSIIPPSHHNVDTDAESGTTSSNMCYLQGTHGMPLNNGARTDTAHVNETSKEPANNLSKRPVKTEVVFDQEVNNRHGPNGHFGSLGTSKAVSVDMQQLESHSHFHKLHLEEAAPKQDNPLFPKEFGAHDGSNTSQFFPDFQVESPSQCGNLKKLDSFGRWMNQEIGDGENSLLTVSSDSGTYWQGTLDDQNAAEEVTSLSQQMQYDVGMRLSLSQKQYFSIIDYSPDHASSKGGTKVLLSVVFLEALKDPSECQWCCMFGEVEVAAELISPGVLRCKAPPHVPGRVPFYITRSDRAACSEVREFVYQEGDSAIPQGTSAEPRPDKKDEPLLQIRFARMLACSGIPFHQRNLKSKGKDETSSKFSLPLGTNQNVEEWSKLEDDYSTDALCKEMLVQLLLKGMLHDWLVYRLEEEEKGASVLDEHGLGVIHMGAALGYDWVISPLLAAGVSINFRDYRGWTALHWAAYHGREKMVVALLASGAAPGLKSDPTPKYPAGQTPADLASLQKHKGIAGYLAESSLTTHLSLLKINGGKEERLTSAFEDEKVVVSLAERIVVETTCSQSEDELSMQDSLAAVRNAIQAAARIQAAFRAQSFRKRQGEQKHKDEEDEYGISNGEAQAIVAAQKSYKLVQIYPDEAMHSAAVRIQQKFRGWKGRKDFLLFRQRVVKIQAHVRGHQVRKQYRKIVWSVSIVEKAILRWRRKGKGLRGFVAEANAIKEANKTKTDTDGEDDFLKVGRKQTEKGLENALARVQSMVKSREARDQYRRMLDGYQKAKEDLEADVSSRSNDEPNQGEDLIMST